MLLPLDPLLLVLTAATVRLRGLGSSSGESDARSAPGPRKAAAEPASAGAANLEAMDAAHNYHAFLTSTVLPWADAASPVLDFGAGTGMHARALRDSGLDIRTVELDPVLREQLGHDGFKVAASSRDFGPGTFGTVYSFNVLEHIEDDAAALAQLHAAAKPGAHLILYVPAFQILFSAMDRRVGHFRRYRRAQLQALVRAAGFRVTHCAYVDSLGFFASLAYRVVARTGELNGGGVALYDRFVFPLSRWLDRLAAPWFGKNLLLVASRD